MRIQHNIAALNSHRQLSSNNSAVSKNLEKLSSGYKINRAGDDAAGLAISEKMRAQITGLDTAQKNANDGISLIQTAEGALTEVHSMLNRMVELADQSANGTYKDDDRAQLQKEIQSLSDEIDRISQGTNFNGINLLDGSMGGGATGASGTFSGKSIEFKGPEGMTFTFADGSGIAAGTNTAAMAGNAVTITLGTKDAGTSFTAADINKLLKDKGIDASVSFDGSIDLAADANTTMGAVTSAKPSNAKITVGGIDFESTKAGDVKTKIAVKKTALATDPVGVTKASNGDITLNLTGNETLEQINEMLSNAGVDIKATKKGTVADGASTALANGTGLGADGLTLQIGDTADSFNQLTVNVGSMSASSLGIDGINISTQGGGKDAVEIIKKAINSVSSTRGDLGALQNRLEHTINNLGVTTENMTAAESRIRDVDMAKEMMTYTKNNILVQASQAMLAQANQLPQGVLQLLQ